MSLCFFFGCWNEPGHFLVAPGGRRPPREYDHVEHLPGGFHLDGSLAPRERTRGRGERGELVWCAQGATPTDWQRIHYDSEEYPQGQYLLHHLPNGFTAIAWWDRCQGDTRGNCSSTVLLEGSRTADEMLAALAEHFPRVLRNLTKHGVTLVEVHKSPETSAVGVKIDGQS